MAGDETVQVSLRVPEYQKSEWKAHADRLDMGQSEFVRSMVQAGRRGFDGPDSDASASNVPEGGDGASDPGGDGLEDRVRTALREGDVLSWDELLDRLVGEIEDEMADALEELQSSGRVRYSGRDGGYALVDDGE